MSDSALSDPPGEGLGPGAGGEGSASTGAQDAGTAGGSVFSAFISYSHKDEHRAAWLQRRLEGFRTPRPLVGSAGANGPIPRRLNRVFRDATELQSGHLVEEIDQALSTADALIVLCSKAAVDSPWVDREIATFKVLRKDGRIFPAIIDGEPHAEGKPGFTAADECFPSNLLHKVAADGTVSDALDDELIASDFRDGKDSEETGFLRIVAGLLGVDLDVLIQRERRAHRNRMIFAFAVMAVMAAATAVAVYKWVDASHQRQRADAALIQMLPQRVRDVFDKDFALNAASNAPLTRSTRFALAGLVLSPAQSAPFRDLLGRLTMLKRLTMLPWSSDPSKWEVSCPGGAPPEWAHGRAVGETPILALGNALDWTGKRLVFVCPDGKVHVRDLDQNKEFVPAIRPGGEVLAAAFDAKSETVEIVSPDGSVRRWDPTRKHLQAVTSADVARTIATERDEDGRGISLLEDGAPAPADSAGTVQLTRPYPSASAIAVSRDNHLAVAHGNDPGFVLIKGGPTGDFALRNVLSHGVTGLAFSPDSRLLATTDLEGRLRIWSVADGTHLMQFRENRIVESASFNWEKSAFSSPSFSGDGKRIVYLAQGKAVVRDIAPLSESTPTLVQETCNTLLSSPAARRFTASDRDDTLIRELWSEEHLAKDIDLCAAAHSAAEQAPSKAKAK